MAVKNPYKYVLEELREYALIIDGDTKCPEEYIKYNKDKIGENPGGRAWIMFFLDLFEKEKDGK